MRVLHVSEIVIGGIGTYLEELLCWQGHEFGHDQVAAILPQAQLDKLSVQAREAVQIIPYHRRARDPLSLLRLWTKIAVQVRRFRPDIIHAHSSFAGFLTRLPLFTGSVPVIYSPNGWAFDRDDSRLMRMTYAGLERFAALRTAGIITCSEHETRIAVKAGVPREFIHVIPHGINNSRLAPESSVARPTTCLELLFIGRLDRQKGFDWLMNAMKAIPQDRVKLTVVGSAVQGEYPELLDQPNISYVGWVSADQIDSYIDNCDAVVMPSRWEGFPFVALETMRRGRALLVSNRGALPEMVVQGKSGCVFDLARPESLRELVEHITPENIVDMGQASRRNFLSHYSSERMNESTASLYREFFNRS